MQIELNKKQYQSLIKLIDVASIVYAVLRDMVSRKKYDHQLSEIEELENYILGFVKDFDMNRILESKEVPDDKNYLSEEYSNETLKDVFEYDEYVFWEKLADKFASQEFFKIYSRKEIKNMNDMERWHKQAEIEDKYWEEFKKYGIERLKMVEN